MTTARLEVYLLHDPILNLPPQKLLPDLSNLAPKKVDIKMKSSDMNLFEAEPIGSSSVLLELVFSKMRASTMSNSAKFIGTLNCGQVDRSSTKLQFKVNSSIVNSVFFKSEIFSTKYLFKAHNSPQNSHVNSNFIVAGVGLLTVLTFILFISLTKLKSLVF